MSAEQGKSIVRRFIEEVLNQGNIEVAEELVAVDYARHTHDYRSEQRSGLEFVKQFAAEQRATIYRLDKGKIAESWVQGDRFGLLQQAGVIAPFGTTGPSST